jgi:hypothetical protein
VERVLAVAHEIQQPLRARDVGADIQQREQDISAKAKSALVTARKPARVEAIATAMVKQIRSANR